VHDYYQIHTITVLHGLGDVIVTHHDSSNRSLAAWADERRGCAERALMKVIVEGRHVETTEQRQLTMPPEHRTLKLIS
jgi:glycerol-3-phosphate dehydrogenase